MHHNDMAPKTIENIFFAHIKRQTLAVCQQAAA